MSGYNKIINLFLDKKEEIKSLIFSNNKSIRKNARKKLIEINKLSKPNIVFAINGRYGKKLFLSEFYRLAYAQTYMPPPDKKLNPHLNRYEKTYVSVWPPGNKSLQSWQNLKNPGMPRRIW